MKSLKLILPALVILSGGIRLHAQTSNTWKLNGNNGLNPSTNFIGNTDNKDFVVRTNNIERMRVLGSGNIGIGTTAPGAKLHVNGSVKISDGTQGAGKVLTSDTAGFATWQPLPSGGIGGSGTTNTVPKFTGATTLGNSSIVDNGTGVGIGTSSPLYTLDVHGNNTFTVGNFLNSVTGNYNSYGVLGTSATTPGWGTGLYGVGGNNGVYGRANMAGAGSRAGLNGVGAYGDQWNYGVYADGRGGQGGIGIYARGAEGADNYAAFFGDGKVYVQNVVGIQNQTPQYPLDVTGDSMIVGNFVSTFNNGDGSGVYGSCLNHPGWGFGLFGEGGWIGVAANATMDDGTSTRYGVYASGGGGESNTGVFGNAYGGTTAYAISGYAHGNGTNWGGFFVGDVYAVGTYQTSDRKLKSDIRPLSDAMSIISKLNPSVYKFKTKEYSTMSLPEGSHYGLIADEVQQVMPDAVKKAIRPAEYDNHNEKTGKKIADAVEFNTVNYTEMIPVLIAGMKEQQAQIEKLNAEIAALKGNVVPAGKLNDNGKQISVELTGMNEPFLGQNSPNPFSNETRIDYYIPESMSCDNSKCRIVIYDQLGRTIKEVTGLAAGIGSVNVTTKNLSNGILMYKLIVNDTVIDTKKMVLNK